MEYSLYKSYIYNSALVSQRTWNNATGTRSGSRKLMKRWGLRPDHSSQAGKEGPSPSGMWGTDGCSSAKKAVTTDEHGVIWWRGMPLPVQWVRNLKVIGGWRAVRYLQGEWTWRIPCRVTMRPGIRWLKAHGGGRAISGYLQRGCCLWQGKGMMWKASPRFQEVCISRMFQVLSQGILLQRSQRPDWDNLRPWAVEWVHEWVPPVWLCWRPWTCELAEVARTALLRSRLCLSRKIP